MNALADTAPLKDRGPFLIAMRCFTNINKNFTKLLTFFLMGVILIKQSTRTTKNDSE